jgi:hypothetical protein
MMKRYTIRNPLSLLAFILLTACILYGRMILPRWLTYDHLSILSWDVFGYYLYLPAQFIYQDLGITDFSWLQQILDKYAPTIGFYQAYKGPDDFYVMKYPMGMAILYIPFFFIAHLIAGVSGFPPDGFSQPYQISVALGCVLYGLIGLWFLRKILVKFFSDIESSLVMVLLVLGTNYFQLTVYDTAMAHNSLFAIYVLILWFTIRWHENQKLKYAIPLGLMIGLATLIRPTEIISAVIPVLWGIKNMESLKQKWSLIINHRFQIIIIAFASVLVIVPQVVYWKVYSGSYLYYSYEEGERLKFLAPYIIHVLFSWKKGWLIYAPMMIFSLAGFCFLYRKNARIFAATFFFFLLNLLIISSWTTWWYGGSLGQRSLMQSYAVLTLPFGYFLQWMITRKLWLKITFFFIAAFFIWLNLFQTWQYMAWIIHPSRMTQQYYWAVFGRKNVPLGSHKFLEVAENLKREYLENEEKYAKRNLTFFNFENISNDKDKQLEKKNAQSGDYAYWMDSAVLYSPTFSMLCREIAPQIGSWIRLTVWIYPHDSFEEHPANVVITFIRQRKNYKYKTIDLANETLKIEEWNKIVMDYEIPYDCRPDDQLKAYIWNRGKGNFLIDNFQLEVLDP